MATKEHTSVHNNAPPFPPSKIPRLSSYPMPDAVTLGLALGLNATSVSRPTTKPVFTFMQMQELEHQALIYKYIAGGLPVPLQLVLPIWKSVAAANCDLCVDYKSSMEPEPGRCRRTDGKKWRCSRDVVANQKYCERHMHRGRNRSRKAVEGGGIGGAGGNGEIFHELMPGYNRD